MFTYIKKRIRKLTTKLVLPIIKAELHAFQFTDFKLFGDRRNLILKGDNITLNNTFINCNSGTVTIEDHAGLAHNCMIITGSHDFGKKNNERAKGIILSGRNIYIEEGAFIGAGSIILGPCRIGKHSVIGAGSVVTKDVGENVIAAGNPCKVIRTLTFDASN